MLAALRACSMPAHAAMPICLARLSAMPHAYMPEGGKSLTCCGRSTSLGLTPTEPCTRQRESPDAQVVLDGADPDAMRVCGDTAGKDPLLSVYTLLLTTY